MLFVLFFISYALSGSPMEETQNNKSISIIIENKFNDQVRKQNTIKAKEELNLIDQLLICRDKYISYNKNDAIEHINSEKMESIETVSKNLYKIFLTNKKMKKIFVRFNEIGPTIDFRNAKYFMQYIKAFLTKDKIRKRKLPIKRFIMSLAWKSYILVYKISLLDRSQLSIANDIYIWTLISNGIDLRFKKSCPYEIKHLMVKYNYENCISTIENLLKYNYNSSENLFNFTSVKNDSLINPINLFIEKHVINSKNYTLPSHFIN
ncbi:uncharacterized protein VNE69_08111 [Vairimorpha necatrix]|uniref:Uncharacterized protein n=1 Tax=Vairimorpha necatrix TaxID=6039 RepID=A0AAX4JEB8_9MICR